MRIGADDQGLSAVVLGGVVAGGGVHYSGAEDALQAFCHATGIPVGETQAGKGSLTHGHPQLMGAVGSTGTTAAHCVAHCVGHSLAPLRRTLAVLRILFDVNLQQLY